MRNYILILLGIFVASFTLVALPFYMVHPPYGKALILSIPPMFLIVLSWVLGDWWGKDKHESVHLALTMGGIPVRIGFVLAWFYLASNIVSPIPLFFGMMFNWCIFSIPALCMVCQICKNKSKW